jgi:hypothetical protein
VLPDADPRAIAERLFWGAFNPVTLVANIEEGTRLVDEEQFDILRIRARPPVRRDAER